MNNDNTLATHPSSLATMSSPWYTHKLVWLVIAIPSSSVLAGMVMLWLAVSSNDGLVVDDYYKRGMAINQDLKRDEKAGALGLGAHLTIEETGDLVTLHFNKGDLVEYPVKLNMGLYFSTKTGFDQQLELHRGMEGRYVGYLQDTLRDGAWNVVVTGGDWRLVTRATIANGVDTYLGADSRP